MRRLPWPMESLRAVLFAYGVGHLATAAMFLGWPEYFLVGSGGEPPWPLSALQFGTWPPVHTGFMNVIAAYDVAVAVALFTAAWDPVRHAGILPFVLVLFVAHGAAHGWHVLFGSSPDVYWVTTAELWVGAALVAGLYLIGRSRVKGTASTA